MNNTAIIVFIVVCSLLILVICMQTLILDNKREKQCEQAGGVLIKTSHGWGCANNIHLITVK